MDTTRVETAIDLLYEGKEEMDNESLRHLDTLVEEVRVLFCLQYGLTYRTTESTGTCQRLSPKGDSLSLDYNSLRSTGG